MSVQICRCIRPTRPRSGPDVADTFQGKGPSGNLLSSSGVVSALAGSTRLEKRPPGEVRMAGTAFIVNGNPVEVDAPPDTPLLWAVREHLALTGTKFGCGAGMCGACTVHVDGRAVRSCRTQLSDVAGKKVTTIEGLSANGDHPLQKAWIAEQVPQCGYCQ